LVFATVSPSGSQFAWPATWDAHIDTSEGEKHFGLTTMAVDWTTVSPDGRDNSETASHELGHVLGLADQYPYDGEDPSAIAREVLGWDPMDYEDGLPYFSIGHRIMLGWLQPPWIKAYNFQRRSNAAAGG
jgi:hypothetical protein